jgi:hypothetical protein
MRFLEKNAQKSINFSKIFCALFSKIFAHFAGVNEVCPRTAELLAKGQ